MNLCVTFGYVKVWYSMLKFLYVSSQGEEEDDGEALCPPEVVEAGGCQEHGAEKVEIVIKPIFFFCFFYFDVRLIIFDFLAVTMTGGTIEKDCKPW